MHYLFKTLVKIAEVDDPTTVSREDLVDEIRQYAEEVTEHFDLFDWRKTDTAGKWADQYPENVVLGAEDGNRLVQELEAVKARIDNQVATYQKLLIGDFGDSLSAVVKGASQESEASLAAYRLGVLATLLEGSVSPYGAFYSTWHETGAVGQKLIDEVKENPQEWAMVFFDHHE